MNSNTVMDKQGGETIEELGDDKPQVGVVDMVIIRYRILQLLVWKLKKTCSNYDTRTISF